MKLGSKLKTWHKRWFVLKDNQLSYYKSQNDVLKGKAKTEINKSNKRKTYLLSNFLS